MVPAYGSLPASDEADEKDCGDDNQQDDDNSDDSLDARTQATPRRASTNCTVSCTGGDRRTQAGRGRRRPIAG